MVADAADNSIRRRLRALLPDTRESPVRLFRACGRVNLIGEHIDYHGGSVLPLAMDRGVWVAMRRRADQRVSLRSEQFESAFATDLAQLPAVSPPAWCRYPLGMVHHAVSVMGELPGFDLAFASDLPVGAGLSSSAAILLATAAALRGLVGVEADARVLADAAVHVERSYLGVPCGIMDPYASALSRHGHALLLDCASGAFEHIPLPVERMRMLLLDSKEPRELAAGGYQQRVEESGRGRDALRRVHPDCVHLARAPWEKFESARSSLGELEQKRVRHVLSEQARVGAAVTALRAQDLVRFGELVNASHESLRDQYEVSTTRLDHLAESASRQPGVFGARVCGAGFGGNVLAIVEPGSEDRVISSVQQAFARRFNEVPKAYQFGFGHEPKEL